MHLDAQHVEHGLGHVVEPGVDAAPLLADNHGEQGDVPVSVSLTPDQLLAPYYAELRKKVDVETIEGYTEAIPLPDAHVDFISMGYALRHIADLAAAFAELRTKNIRNLIIDLRGNSGGSMDIGFELARYLARDTLPRDFRKRHGPCPMPPR